MGALTAYVHVRLCCSLCHHGRHAHRSLPRRNRRIYGCTLPAGTKTGRRGTEGSMRKQREGRPHRNKNKEINRIRDDDLEDETKQKQSLFWLETGDEEMEWGEEWGRYSRAGRRAGEVSSPPPIREFGCSDVWLAVKADRQIAANDMCWESSQRWANDRRGEVGRWLTSGKYACSIIPVVWTKSAWTFGIEGNK